MILTSSGAPEISAPPDLVWQRLMDPDIVARSAPGVESVERIDETHFTVICGFGVGALKLRFTLEVELSNMTPPVALTMRTLGKAHGSALNVSTDIRLESLEANRTRLNWTAETEVNGALASLGAGLLEGIARRLTDQFWKDFAEAAGRD